MKIGYVCTNYNNSSFTRGAIASLKNGPRGTDVRVVVVDNQSRAEDVAQLRALAAEFADVELVLNPDNAGYFPGLNIGIRRMRERWPDAGILAVGNNDLVFPPDFVDTVERHRDVLGTWAVVAPDLVTFDGVHQNPHVLHPISPLRKLTWDLYYVSYGTAQLIKRAARLTRRFTIRAENDTASELYTRPGPIEQGYGACYLIGPTFFRHFARFCAPTFMMHEEFFLFEQLKVIGQLTYFDPRFVVRHHGHATTDLLPGRRQWAIARDAHLVYKRYLRLSPDAQRRLIADCAGVASRGTVLT
jgi:GT2 family glycosyltransferase